MYLRQLLRKPRALPLSKLSTRPHRSSRLFRRFESTDTKTSARANRVLDRVPKFLRRYTDVLRNAPVSHIVAFLILHEITAIVPLVGLAGYFHYANWLPPFFSEGAYISTGVEKFGRYFRRKGWFGLLEDSPTPTPSTTSDHSDLSVNALKTTRTGQVWNFSETGTKVIVEVATAYAITKALLPLRLVFSVWATPWFARVWVVGLGRRIQGVMGGLLGKRKGRQAAAAGVTGTSGSVVGKEASKNL